MPDGCAQVQSQRAWQTIDARLRQEAEDLPVGQVVQNLRDAREIEAALAGAEEAEDGPHRAAGDEFRLQPGRLEEREGREVDIARSAAAAADQHQVAIAHFSIEPLRGELVAELSLDLGERAAGNLRSRARGGAELIGARELQALRVEQWPEHLDQPLAEGTQQRGDGHVAAVGGAHVPAAAERKRVAQRVLILFVEPAARGNRGAGELRLHGRERADLGESLLQARHLVPSRSSASASAQAALQSKAFSNSAWAAAVLSRARAIRPR